MATLTEVYSKFGQTGSFDPNRMKPIRPNQYATYRLQPSARKPC